MLYMIHLLFFVYLTDNNLQQAIERSGGNHGNKGTEAAVAAIKMASLEKRLIIKDHFVKILF